METETERCARCGLPLTAHPSECPWNPPERARAHAHDQVPANPADGDTFACECGYAAQWVDLDDGQPGEWVSV